MWALCNKIIAGNLTTLWVNLALISGEEAKRTIVKVYGYENRLDLDSSLKISPKRLEDRKKYKI